MASLMMAAARRGVGRVLEVPPRLSRVVFPASARSFNTSAELRDYDCSEDRGIDVHRKGDGSPAPRHRESPGFFSDVMDPFFPARSSLSQVMNMMDQFMDNPFASASRGLSGGARRGWDAREDNDGLYLRIDMPGLDKEHVKVCAEQNTLIITGEGEPEREDEEGRKYSCRIDLPEKLYKMDGIKAEMKNGVLKVFVPKVKEEERKDVFQIQIE